MEHFISVDQLTEEEIITLIQIAQNCKNQEILLNKTIFVANLFYEPSTRTKMSFAVAEKKLGLEVFDFSLVSSSVEKGESLYDTAKTFQAIGTDLLIIRHPADQWFKELNTLDIPVINAGAGKSEHPTQCMLDLFTIYEEFGTFLHLNITIAGDIKYSRVAYSAARALTRLGANVFFSAPPGLEREMPNIPHIPLDEAIEFSDVVMMLRIQNERHSGAENNQSTYLHHYGMTKEREARMKKGAIIMHPAPINRNIEIDSDVVECDRSRIFKQMENGVYIRMAIIKKILNDWGLMNENIIEEYNLSYRQKRTRSL